MIEITLPTTTGGEERTKGTRIGRGTTINAEIRTTDGVTIIGEMSVVIGNKLTDEA